MLLYRAGIDSIWVYIRHNDSGANFKKILRASLFADIVAIETRIKGL